LRDLIKQKGGDPSDNLSLRMLCILYSQSSFSFFDLRHFVQPLLRIMGWTIEYLIVVIVASKRRFADLVIMATFIVQRNALMHSARNLSVQRVKNIRTVGQEN
jgi:hypothetical protein